MKAIKEMNAGMTPSERQEAVSAIMLRQFCSRKLPATIESYIRRCQWFIDHEQWYNLSIPLETVTMEIGKRIDKAINDIFNIGIPSDFSQYDEKQIKDIQHVAVSYSTTGNASLAITLWKQLGLPREDRETVPLLKRA